MGVCYFRRHRWDDVLITVEINPLSVNSGFSSHVAVA